MSQHPNMDQTFVSTPEILRAAAEGVLSQTDAERLIHWAFDQQFNRLLIPEPQTPAPERRKGFNLVTVLYYFGALLMISACGWFLGDKWNELGVSGICITVLLYIAGLTSLGMWLRRKGFLVGGGLLITVAVSLAPLVTYTIEKMINVWPALAPGSYSEFYPMIHASWIGK